MQRQSEYDLPVLPLRRFYVKDDIIRQMTEAEGNGAWVEAESAIVAVHMARTLWKPWFTGFSHEEYVDPETGEECRFEYTVEGGLDSLRQVLKQQEARR